MVQNETETEKLVQSKVSLSPAAQWLKNWLTITRLRFHIRLMAQRKRKWQYKRFCSRQLCPSSTVVNHLTHYPKVEGSNLTTVIGRTELIGKSCSNQQEIDEMNTETEIKFSTPHILRAVTDSISAGKQKCSTRMDRGWYWRVPLLALGLLTLS